MSGDLPKRLRGEISDAVRRLICGSFRRDGERLPAEQCPRFSIPTRPEHDDDCVVLEALNAAASRIEALEKDVAAKDRLLVASSNAIRSMDADLDVAREALDKAPRPSPGDHDNWQVEYMDWYFQTRASALSRLSRKEGGAI